jgi:hypothetical protein
VTMRCGNTVERVLPDAVTVASRDPGSVTVLVVHGSCHGATPHDDARREHIPGHWFGITRGQMVCGTPPPRNRRGGLLYSVVR